DDYRQSIKDLAEYCREQDDIPEDQIKQVENEYRNHTPIWWYTAETFTYSMLYRGRRQIDVNIILKMGFFVRHLHNHIAQLHREQQGSMPIKFQVCHAQALPPSHPDLATSYNNTGIMYKNMGEYSKALLSHERSLEIRKIVLLLPPNHPDLAASYNNIGIVYNSMGVYSKALSLYERSLEIKKIALTKNHLDLALSYNNIGVVYQNMGEYSTALSSYERSLEIKKIALPSNHPVVATSYNNIGMVYGKMGDYSKALLSYERSLEIKKIALPSNHPCLATSYNHIGLIYDNLGEYSKALSSYKRSLEIRKIALPPNYPDLAASYNSIGNVYQNMGEYSKTLSSYERSLEIRKIALPPNHPDLATSYNNIGIVYKNVGEYSKALSSYERSLEIQKVALPPNHPDLAASYNNIGNFIECLRCAYDCPFVAFPLNVSIPINVCKHQERDNAQCSVILEIDFESQLVSGALNIENRCVIASLKTETKFKLKSNSVISTIWYTCTMSDFCDFEFINELLTNILAQINAISLQQKLIDFLYTPIPSQINIQCSNILCSWNSFCQSDFQNIFTPQYNYTYIDGTLPCIQISQNDQFIKITQQYLPSTVQLSEMNMRCNVKQCGFC
ncbi:unnamed protein product, partial [Rotaria sordida]